MRCLNILLLVILLPGCVTYNPELLKLEMERVTVYEDQRKAEINFATRAWKDARGREQQIIDKSISDLIHAEVAARGGLDAEQALKWIAKKEEMAAQLVAIDDQFKNYIDHRNEIAESLKKIQTEIVKVKEKQGLNNRKIWEYGGQIAAIIITGVL